MKNIILAVLIIFFANSLLIAQNYNLLLWDKEIPNSIPGNYTEIRDTTEIVRISRVQRPGVEVFLPSKRNANGAAVVICPGGAYKLLAYDWEGSDVAKWLNSQGIAAIVLKYRLPDDETNRVPWETPLLDAKRALRLTRYNALKWNIDPHRIGIMGFSAGGHLACTAGIYYDTGVDNANDPVEKMSSRPDFMALIYPVITFNPKITHSGSVLNLLGPVPSDSLLEKYSNEKHVSSKTPPAFLVHAADDKAVPAENSLLLVDALMKNSIPVELHIFPVGGHGFSLGVENESLHQWPQLFIQWVSGFDPKNN